MSEVSKQSPNQDSPAYEPSEHDASYAVPDQKTQEAWESFYQRDGRPRYEGLLRKGFIDRQLAIVADMKKTVNGKKEVDQLINEFQDWAPTSLAEGRSILRGPAKSANIAANSGGESAASERIQKYQGYLIEAAHDLNTMQSVLSHSAIRGYHPDPNKFRSSKEAQEVVIRQLMTREFLWGRHENHWPSKNSREFKEREKYWTGFVTEAVKIAGNDALAAFVSVFYQRTEKRFLHWRKENSWLENTSLFRSLVEKGQVIPITVGDLLASKYQRTWEEELSGREGDREPINFDAMLSPQARKEIEEHRRQDEERVRAANDNFDLEYEIRERSMHSQPFQIREDLAAKGIARALPSAEQFEADEAAEQAEVSERARRSKAKQSKKTHIEPRGASRWRGRETGPSDKRKETDYR